MDVTPSITVILTKLVDMVIGIVTRWARNCLNEYPREKEELVEGYEMGDKKRQEM